MNFGILKKPHFDLYSLFMALHPASHLVCTLSFIQFFFPSPTLFTNIGPFPQYLISVMQRPVCCRCNRIALLLKSP